MKRTFDAAQASAAGAVGLHPGESFSVAVNELLDVLAPGSTVITRPLRPNRWVQVSASSTTVTVTAVSAGIAAVRVTARVTGASAAVPRTRRDKTAAEHTVTATPACPGSTAVTRRGWRARASPARMSSAPWALTSPVVLMSVDDMREVRGCPVHFRGADKSSLSDPAVLTRK